MQGIGPCWLGSLLVAFKVLILPANLAGGGKMQQTGGVVDTVSRIAGKYGVWIILGLMVVEIGLARRRGEL